MGAELFSNIIKSIVELNEQGLSEFIDLAIGRGVSPVDIVEKGCRPGIEKLGELFESNVYFLPELVTGSELVTEAITKVEKLIPTNRLARKGIIVIGTVEGDIHSIGKNLVASMLSANGIQVIDIGVDCHVDKFIDCALEENANIIGASSLMTMTAPEIRKLVNRLKERELRERFKVIAGGAALNSELAKEMGCDGFGEDVQEAIDVVLSILSDKKGGWEHETTN